MLETSKDEDEGTHVYCVCKWNVCHAINSNGTSPTIPMPQLQTATSAHEVRLGHRRSSVNGMQVCRCTILTSILISKLKLCVAKTRMKGKRDGMLRNRNEMWIIRAESVSRNLEFHCERILILRFSVHNIPSIGWDILRRWKFLFVDVVRIVIVHIRASAHAHCTRLKAYMTEWINCEFDSLLKPLKRNASAADALLCATHDEKCIRNSWRNGNWLFYVL